MLDSFLQSLSLLNKEEQCDRLEAEYIKGQTLQCTVFTQGQDPFFSLIFLIQTLAGPSHQGGWCFSFSKSLCLDEIWRSLGEPWPSFLWIAPCKAHWQGALKFVGSERGQEYRASKTCMMHSRLLSVLHNVFVLLHLLLKFNSWEYLYV